MADFSNQREILNFVPKIRFIEPEQVPGEVPTEHLVVPASLDEIRSSVTDIIEQYDAIETLADATQERINERAKGLSIKLDLAQDAHVLDALKRHFNDPDKTEITYDDYFQCIQEANEAARENVLTAQQDDVDAAASDPYRTSFGLLSKQPGLARPELDKTLQVIKPIDMDKFKNDQLNALFTIMVPDIIKLVTTGKVVRKIVELVIKEAF